MSQGFTIEELKDAMLEFAKGNVSGTSVIHNFGHNQAVGTSLETIWTEGGIYVYRTTATTMTISSDNANDTSAGTGARTVLVEGLDTNYDEISETLTMNGTSGVTSANSYLRVHKMTVKTAGSGGQNAGIIYLGTGTITAGKPAVVHGLIDTTLNQSLLGFYTIPNGKTGYIAQVFFSSGSQKASTAVLKVRPLGEVFQTKGHDHFFQDIFNIQYTAMLKFEEKSDIELRVEVDAGTAEMSGFFGLIFDFIAIYSVTTFSSCKYGLPMSWNH